MPIGQPVYPSRTDDLVSFVGTYIDASIEAQIHLAAAPTGVAATDTAAILAAQALGPGIIQLRAGTYITNAAIPLTSYQTLRGVGKTGTTIRFVNTVGGTVNMVQLSSGRQEQCQVQRLTLDGNFSGQDGINFLTDSLTNGAFASGLLNPRFRLNDLLIRNTGRHGINLAGDSHGGEAIISDTQVYFAAGYGIWCQVPDSVIANCDIGQSGLDGCRDEGYVRYEGTKAWLSGRIDDTSSGFRMRSGSVAVGCIAEDSAQHGYQLFGANNVIVQGQANTNGKRFVSGGNGVDMQNCTGCNIDIMAFDRRGDTGTDSPVQQFAVNLTGATRNVVKVAAGLHVVGAIPTAQLSSDNVIIVNQVGGTQLPSRVPHTVVSHVDSVFMAGAASPILETMDRRDASSGSISPANGVVQFTYFTAALSEAITKLGMDTRGTAATTTTFARLGLYTVAANGDLTLVARTANTTTFASATFTPYDIALDATGGFVTSYSLVGGLRYAIGIIMVGMTVAPILYGVATPRAGTGIVLSRKMTAGGQTDLPTSLASGSMSADSNQYYATLTP